MKKLVSSFLALLAVVVCSAQDIASINVTEPGTLGTLLGENKNEVTTLILTGKINGDDVAVMRDLAKEALKSVDMKDADIVGGGSAFYTDKDGKEWYTEDDKVPGYMFYECLLNTVALPDTGTEIGENAFSGCTDLAIVLFGSQLKKIGNNAFYNCEKLTEANLPDFLEEIGDNAFANCKNMATVHFSLNLKNIGAKSFMQCESIQEVILPEGMISLGASAFLNAKGVKKIALPASLSDVQAEAFSNCSSLMEIYEYAVNIPTFGANVFNGVDKKNCVVYVPAGMADDYSECNAFMDFANIQEFKTTEREVTVTVTEPGTLGSLLGDEALKTVKKLTLKGKINNDDLKTLAMMAKGADYITGEQEYNLSYIDMEGVDIVAGGEDSYVDGELYPGEDNTITAYTFDYCAGLEQIILPKSLEVIGAGAFNSVENLTDITVFDKVREIGGNAFYGTNIHAINIPEGVEVIKERTFSKCENLKEVTLPSTLKAIEKMAFMTCRSLTEIKIPEGVTTFGMGTFSSCENLLKIWLPSTLADMGSLTFSNCLIIEEIHIAATTPPVWNNKPFGLIYESTKLYVPAGCKEAYQNSEVDENGYGWSAFKQIEEENGGSGIDKVVENFDGATYYTISGVRLDKPMRGMNIVRLKDGTVKKVFVR